MRKGRGKAGWAHWKTELSDSFPTSFCPLVEGYSDEKSTARVTKHTIGENGH